MQPRLTMVLASTLLAILLNPAASTAWQEPARDAVQGQGAAGVTEVGRPLDVLRARAERQAHERAIEDLYARVLKMSGTTGDGKKGETLHRKVQERAESKQALWQTRYWTNGAVTTSVMINAADLLDPGAHGTGGEK